MTCRSLRAYAKKQIRYFGYYSDVSRGKRRNENQDGIDPRVCPPCGKGKMVLKEVLAPTPSTAPP